MSKTYLSLIYFISVLFFFNYSSTFIFWIMVEFNLLMFVMMIYLFKNFSLKQEMFDLAMFYFLIQSMASILLLSDFFFSSDFHIFNSDCMFIISILIKLGIFPFFYWVFKLSNYLNSYSLSILLTIQKIPFFLILFNSMSIWILYILMSSFIIGSILVLFSKDLIYMLVASSISGSFWFFYLYLNSFFFFLFFYLSYSVFLFYLINQHMNSKECKGSKFWLGLFFFSFLLGLSPFSLFFFKYSIMGFISLNLGALDSVLFWFFGFLSLFGYLIYSMKSFFWSTDFYFQSLKLDLEYFFFFFSVTTFFFFLF